MKHYEILIILLFCLSFIPFIKNQDCSGCAISSNTCTGTDNCDSNCKPYFGSNICKYCGYNTNNYKFYLIDSDGNCERKQNCNSEQLIVHGTYECVPPDTPSCYIMGDYCYSSQPSGTVVETSNIYKCPNYYYITKLPGTEIKEYHCVSSTSLTNLPNGYIYLNFDTNEIGESWSICSSTQNKKKIEYEPTTSIKYRCSANCVTNEKLTEDSYCVDDCALSENKKFYYPNEDNKNILKCISDCNDVGKKEQNRECVSECDIGYYLENNKCVSRCSTGYYTGNNICVDDSSDCLYSQDEQNSNNKRCYTSCADIGNGYIYKRESMCSNVECSNFYSEKNGMKICYDTTTECKNDGYDYYQNNKCLKECLGYEDGDNSGSSDLILCFTSISECIENHFTYYELTSRKCFSNSCPNNYYPKYPSENNGYQCIDCSNLKISNGFCKDNCENDECFFIDENNVNHIAINKCNSISNHFYYIDSSNKKICVDDCQSINKFHFLNDYKCIDKCKKTENNIDIYMYYNPTNNLCVEECINLFSKTPTNNHEKCDGGCPIGYKYLIESTYNCLDNCPDTHPYYFPDENFDTNGHYICKDTLSCTGASDEIYFFNGQCVSAETCKANSLTRINSKKICVGNCEPGYNYIKEVVEGLGVYECIQNCDDFKVNNNICVDKCPLYNNYIGTDNKCNVGCEETYRLKYYEIANTPYPIYQCVSSCPGEYPYELYDSNIGDRQCYKKCPEGHKYLYNGNNKCYDICSRVNAAPFSLTKLNNGVEEHICSLECDTDRPYFYEDKICISDCTTPGKTIKDYNNQCVESCNQNSEYKYNLNGKCANKCNDGNGNNNYILEGACTSICDKDKYFFNLVRKNLIETGDKECILNCPNRFYKKSNLNERICIDHCPSTDYALIDTFECLSSCDLRDNDNNYIYHTYEPGATYSVKTCVKQCPSERPYLDKENNICVNSCRNLNFKYLLNNECIESCNEGQYYIGQFLSNDNTETENKCLNDCPQRYPYYIQADGDTKFICSNECPDNKKFHKNSIPDKIGMECINECTNEYKYLSDNEKECLLACPVGKYYVEEVGQKCLSECPDNYFHSKNDYKCITIEQCPGKYIDYEKKLCLTSCEGFKYQYEEKDSTNTLLYTICLNDCAIYNNKFLTPNNKCVDSCDASENLIADPVNEHKCKCVNLYYKDISTSEITCLESTQTCADAPNNQILKYNTQDCLHTCPDVLTLNSETCFKEEENQCDTNKESIELISSAFGQKQCNCKYKFYIDNTGKKFCLNSGEKCPNGYELYNPITRQCVDDCGSLKQFKNLCLNTCPEGASTTGSNLCECPTDKYWYQISEYNYKCLPGACPTSHPFLIPEIKQCVPNCKNTEYPFLVNNKCYSSCSDFSNTQETSIDTFTSLYEFATKTCQCDNLWYYDENTKENVCPPDTEAKTSCKKYEGYNFNYQVKKTKQCVITCPNDYSYSFNDECFHSCSDNDNIKQNGNSKICICNNLWKYETEGEIKKITCLSQSDLICPENYLEIYDTRECLYDENNEKICPRESPLELNGICYKENSCPSNSHYDQNIAGKCTCVNLWYKEENNNDKIHCLPRETLDCPNDYPYQIIKTKECIKPSNLVTKCSEDNHYVFNFICYENSCPEFTKDTGDQICVCDESKGKWYKETNENNGNIYLTCGLNECPSHKPNLLEEKLQYTLICNEDGENTYIWSYRNLCYEECPEFTEEDETLKACVPFDLNTAEDLEELNNFVSVQVKELYDKGPVGGTIFNKFDSSLQIYPVNKLGNSPAKDITMKSNLTYINLDNCINKIFQDQGLDDDDYIFIVKYDLLNKKKEQSEKNNNNNNDGDNNGNGGGDNNDNNPNPNQNPNDANNNKDIKNCENYLINEVEYEFYSSKTLNKIDASVCSSKEIIISYPISYTLAKFDNDEGSFNLNSYRQKFNLGKELYHKDNTVDIFNFNNSIYKELCTPLEINGKDLVYEQRYDILYPNNITLCEKNCTLYYTDYELGRINCKCDYKEILDFNREMPAISDLLNDPSFSKPTQSGANIEIMKCLSKLPNKDSIIKNEAFYISLIIIAGEVGMMCLAGFYGIKVVKSTIYNLGRKMSNKNKLTENENKNDNVVISSNRKLYNNPPKKNSMIVNDDINKEENNDINYNTKENSKEKKPYNIIKKRILFNLNKNKDEDMKEINKDKTSFDLEIKDIDLNTKNNFNDFIEIKDIKGKAEFIPPGYNFKFFKPSDEGIILKMSKKEIPFKIRQETKYLLE